MACVRRVEELSTDPNFVGYYDIEEARKQETEDIKETYLGIGMEKGIKQGIEQGSKEKQIEIAKNLLNTKLSLEEISKVTCLSINELQQLK